MLKKFTTLVLAAVSLVIFLPVFGSAATSNERTTTVSENSVNNFSATQRRWRRWNRNRRWNNTRRVRVIRQVYYRNGRRYVRYIRVYR